METNGPIVPERGRFPIVFRNALCTLLAVAVALVIVVRAKQFGVQRNAREPIRATARLAEHDSDSPGANQLASLSHLIWTEAGSTVRSLQLSPNDEYLAAQVSRNGDKFDVSVLLIQVATGKVVIDTPSLHLRVRTCFTPASDALIIYAPDSNPITRATKGIAAIYNTADGTKRNEIDLMTEPGMWQGVDAIGISQDARTLAMLPLQRTPESRQAWDIETGVSIPFVPGMYTWNGAGLSPNGELYSMGGWPGPGVRIRRFGSGDLVGFCLRGALPAVNSSFSDDNRLWATVYDDGLLVVWDIHDPVSPSRQLLAQDGFDDCTAFAISHSDRQIVRANTDGTIRIAPVALPAVECPTLTCATGPRSGFFPKDAVDRLVQCRTPSSTQENEMKMPAVIVLGLLSLQPIFPLSPETIRAVEPEVRPQLPPAEQDVVTALEKHGAFVVIRKGKQAESEDVKHPTMIVIIGSSWTGSDDDLKFVHQLSTLQGLYVVGAGRVTDKSLQSLRAARPDISVERRSEVILGIQTAPATKGERQVPGGMGVELTRVVEGTPAMHAGFRVGDRLIELAGKPVPNFEALQELLIPLKPGQSVSAKLERDNLTISVAVKFPGSDTAISATDQTDSTDGTVDDKGQKIPGQDNPVLKKIVSPEVQVTGEWRGSRLPVYEGNVLTIEEVPGENGFYRLEFSFLTDYRKPQREKRTGKLANGIIKLDKPVRKIGLARDAFDVLYTVRVDGKEFLLPSVHAENLKSADELNSKIAYLLHERPEKP